MAESISENQKSDKKKNEEKQENAAGHVDGCPEPAHIEEEQSSSKITPATAHHKALNYQFQNTHDRIFGDIVTKSSPSSSPRKDNAPAPEIPEVMPSPRKDCPQRAHSARKKDGNPLTGEGYGQDNDNRHRRHVPPGGYSTSLW